MVEVLIGMGLALVGLLLAATLLSGSLRASGESLAANSAALDARKATDRIQRLIEDGNLAYIEGNHQLVTLHYVQNLGLHAERASTTNNPYGTWEGDNFTVVNTASNPSTGAYLIVNTFGQALPVSVNAVAVNGSRRQLNHSDCTGKPPFKDSRAFPLRTVQIGLGSAINTRYQTNLEANTLYFREGSGDFQPLLESLATFKLDFVYKNAAGATRKNPTTAEGFTLAAPANYTSLSGVEWRMAYVGIYASKVREENPRDYTALASLKSAGPYSVRRLENCAGPLPPPPTPGNLAVTFTLPSGVVSSRFNRSATANGPAIANTTFTTDRTWNNIEQGSYSVSATNVNYEVSPGNAMLGIDPVYATYFPMVLPGNTVNVGGNATTTVNIRYGTTPLANLSITVRGLPAGVSPAINLSDAGGSYPISGSSVLQVFEGSYTLAASEVANPGGGIPYTATLYQVSGTSETVIRNPVYGTPTTTSITAPGSYVVEYARNSGSLSVNITTPPAIAGLARVLVSGPIGATNTGTYAIGDTLSANRNYTSVIPGDYSIVASPVSAGGLTYTATVTPQSPRVERNGSTTVNVNYGCAGGSECVAVRVNVTASGGVSGTIGAVSIRNHSTADQNGGTTVTQNCPTAVGNTNCLPGAFALDNTVGLVQQDLITNVAQWATVGVRSSAVRTTTNGTVRCWRWDAVQGTTVSFVNFNSAANTPRVQVNYVLPTLNRRLDGTTLHNGTIGTVRAPSGVSGFGTYGWNSQSREEVTLNFPLQEVTFCYDSARDDAQRALDELDLKCPSYNGTTNVPYGLTTEQYRQLEQQYRNQLAACTVRVNVQGGQFVCTGTASVPIGNNQFETVGFSIPEPYFTGASIQGNFCSVPGSMVDPRLGSNPGGTVSFTLTSPTCSFDVAAGPHYDRYGTRTSFQYSQAQAQQVCTNRALP